MMEDKDIGRKCSPEKKVPKIFLRLPPEKKGLRARRRQFSGKHQAISKKKGSWQIFRGTKGHGHGPFLTIQKIVLSSSRGLNQLFFTYFVLNFKN